MPQHPTQAQTTWTAVDDYLTATLVPIDAALAAVPEANAAAGLPAIDVAANQGKFLQLLAQFGGARRILEIGTLGGYSTIWLARALPVGGRLITLEFDPHHAEVARANIARAGLSESVDVRIGAARDTLALMIAEAPPPFDFIFIDADKNNYPHYLDLVLQLARPGTLIVADNVIRDGAVIDAASTDERVQGVRLFLEKISTDPRLSATALQTVGGKGYDGFAMALVLS